MTGADWIAVCLVFVAALVGLRKGLIGSALSAAGIVGGAVLGARLGPHLLAGGSRSPYTPLAALAGALVLALLFEAIGTVAGEAVRSRLRLTPLGTLDAAGGLVLGALAGLAVVWVLGAVALLLPGQVRLRQAVQRSAVLRELNDIAPPSRVLEALARVDPFPTIAGPLAAVPPPDPRVLALPGVEKAASSVVRVIGTACGLSVEGSGWIARPSLVVTAAHVVAGEHDTEVELPGGRGPLRATAVAFDPRNDVAVLRIPGPGRPLALADPRPGTPVAILGYPEDGPLAATAGRIGRTVAVLSDDAYGRGPIPRTITSLRGGVRHGNSGGPAVDARGAVQTTVFAARVGSNAGFGIPSELVRRALDRARKPVSTGPCAS